MRKILSIVGVIAILIVILLINPFTIVDAGERGVVLTWGAFEGTVLQPGLHFVTPIAQRVVKMDVRTDKLEIENSEAYSRDLQLVQIHSVLNYHVDEQKVGSLYQNVGLSYKDKILQPALEAAIKQVVAKYTAEEILSKRAELQTEVEGVIRDSVSSNQIVVTKYSFVNEQFSEAYEQAIEKKQVAEQDALRSENELKRVKIEAEQRIAQAQGEAEAIRIQAEAVNKQGGADYVKLKWIEKWDGKVPQYQFGGGATPLIQLDTNK